jgi:hypothetical protein
MTPKPLFIWLLSLLSCNLEDILGLPLKGLPAAERFLDRQLHSPSGGLH